MQRWIGRVALVTGASSGAGAGICKKLVKDGMTVVGCAKSFDRIQTLASDEELSKAPGKLHAIKCDLSKESEILGMFDEIRKKFGHVDVCINNAGFATDSPLMSGKTEEWRSLIEVNVLGLCICTRESLLLMKEKKIDDGHVIHIGSIVGHKVPILFRGIKAPGFGIYYGTKFMVRSLAEALRQELKETSSGIRVATITPGAIETEFMRRSLGPETSTNFFGNYPNCLQSNDIADAVTFVLSAAPRANVEDVILQPLAFSV